MNSEQKSRRIEEEKQKLKNRTKKKDELQKINMKLLFICCIIISALAKINLNINLRLPSEMEEGIINYVNDMTSKANIQNGVNFTQCAPHITLYLTDFDENKIDDIIKSIAVSLEHVRGCEINLGEPYLSGQYYMWSVNKSECLQKLSDTLVQATSKYRSSDYQCPSWIDNLDDEAQKERKKKYCELYGSPNVYEEFDPHITLVTSDKQDLAPLNNYEHPILHGKSTRMCTAVTGEWGTVLRGTEKIFVYLNPVLTTFK